MKYFITLIFLLTSNSFAAQNSCGSSAYEYTEQFCAAETRVVRGGRSWSLNSTHCYFGADFIENYPNATEDMIKSACRYNDYCYQAVWAYKRALKPK